MQGRFYTLDSEGLRLLLEHYAGNPGYSELASYVDEFRDGIIAYAEQSLEWKYNNAPDDAKFIDLLEEELDFEDLDFDTALDYLNAPGWGYTTDALGVIDDFISNVNFFLAEYDPDYPDAETEPRFSLFKY